MHGKWKGIIISESLEEPSLLNEFDVYRARISSRDKLIDDDGTRGRWHQYWVHATDKQIDPSPNPNQKRVVCSFLERSKTSSSFPKEKFEFQAKDKSTWKEIVDCGKSISIPEEQLEFPTNGIPWPSSVIGSSIAAGKGKSSLNRKEDDARWGS